MLGLDIKKKLNNFTLDIKCSIDSRRIGILGSSGAGKSMILKMLAGIERPDKGFIKLGEDVVFDSKGSVDIKPQRRNIGYCFQNYALFPNLTVYENIVIGLDRNKRALAEEYLEKFDLTVLRNSRPAKISGGQASRVAMARMLIRDPKVLLFDEAFSALDIYLRDHIQEEISELLNDFNGIAVFVSHSRDEIYRFCDSMMILDAGKVSNYGNTKEIFKSPKTRTAAILTGCKNISDIEYISENEVFAKDWGKKLVFLKKLPKDLKAVGIRAHDFIPKWEKTPGNTFDFKLRSKAKLPFEDNYYLRTEGQSDITWLVQRDIKDKVEKKGFPKLLEVNEEDILLLE